MGTRVISKEEFAKRVGLALEDKIALSYDRIVEWYEAWDGMVYVSFSGGKDSAALLHLTRSIFPEVPGVFLNTGLEYPEIIRFVRQTENITWLRPTRTFTQIFDKFGAPMISKEVAQKLYETRTTSSEKLRNKRLHGDVNGNGKIPEKWKFMINAPFDVASMCCDVLKKAPAKKYEKKSGRVPFIGTMACESSLRMVTYSKTGCNAFDLSRPRSTPIAFWTEKDIWGYIKKYNVKISKIYDLGYKRTGCFACAFGTHIEDHDRFSKMKKTHPKHYKFCMEKLGYREKIEWIKNNLK